MDLEMGEKQEPSNLFPKKGLSKLNISRPTVIA